MKQVPDVRVTLAPSRAHVALAIVGASATVVLMVMLPLPWWCQAAVVAFCAVALVFEVRSAHAYGHLRITLSAQRRVTVLDGQNERRGEVLDASYVSGAFTSIVWRPDDAWLPRVIPFPSDAVNAEQARRLRLLLRYGRSDPDASDGPGASASSWLKGDMSR